MKVLQKLKKIMKPMEKLKFLKPTDVSSLVGKLCRGLLCLLLLASCSSGETSGKYCRLPARLNIENVTQAPVLFTACESMGEYCTVKPDGQRFIFTDATGHSSAINITALTGYSGYYLGLSGLIVGKLTIPEMGEDQVRVVCFDLACSNCYLAYNITKPLQLQTSGYAKCHSCQRTYNLNDCGNISDGPAGQKLFRYRVNYVGLALVVNNGV